MQSTLTDNIHIRDYLSAGNVMGPIETELVVRSLAKIANELSFIRMILQDMMENEGEEYVDSQPEASNDSV